MPAGPGLSGPGRGECRRREGRKRPRARELGDMGQSRHEPERRARRTARAARPAADGAAAGAGDDVARARRRAPVELRPLRLAALVLLLLAAWLFVSPLRAFFAQQDRYDRQVATLTQAQAQNKALHTQIAEMHTRDFITREAREQYQLVPADMQAFVVKGLPRDETTPAPSSRAAALESPSLLARLVDLWHTLRR